MAEPAISKLQNNPLREIKIAKITLNVGAGKDEEMLGGGVIVV